MAPPLTPAQTPVAEKPRCSICGTNEGEILAFGDPEDRDERDYECRACWGPDDLPEGTPPEAKRLRDDLQIADEPVTPEE